MKRIILIMNILLLTSATAIFGFGKKHNTIDVTFIESASQEAFAKSKIPVEQLPDSFEIDTTLDIGDQKWSVDKTEPLTKEEFVKTGTLKVYLTKIQTIDPNELLYSLPTINNGIAQVSKLTKADNNLFIVHEDDWRQIEFVSIRHDAEIANELKAIYEIHKNHRQGPGFKQIHVRELIHNPLKNLTISVESLKQHFGDMKEYSGVSFDGNNTFIKNGFAFMTKENLILWGDTSSDGSIQNICLAWDKKPSELIKMIDSLSKFCKTNKLFLIDWCRVYKTSGEQKELSAYFKD